MMVVRGVVGWIAVHWGHLPSERVVNGHTIVLRSAGADHPSISEIILACT